MPKEPPEPFPPPPSEPPHEPFRLSRTPPSGTLVGLAAPRGPRGREAPPRPPPLPPVVVSRSPVLEPAGELERRLEGVRLELAHFRGWWPEQLAAVRSTGLGARPSRGFSPAALAGGVALGLALGAALGLSWPALAPPAPGMAR